MRYNLERMKIYYDERNIKYKEFKNFYIIFKGFKQLKHICKTSVKYIGTSFMEFFLGFLKIIFGIVVGIFAILTEFIPRIRIKENKKNG